MKGDLTLRERIDIEKKYSYGKTITEIDKFLQRNKSTISREIDGRPPTGIGKYQADITHREYLKRKENKGNISKLKKIKDLLNGKGAEPPQRRTPDFSVWHSANYATY